MTLPDGTVEEQNDFLRAARQQEFLLSSRSGHHQPADLAARVSERGVRDGDHRLSATQVGDLATLAPLIASGDVERVVLGWPEYVEVGPDPLVYLPLP